MYYTATSELNWFRKDLCLLWACTVYLANAEENEKHTLQCWSNVQHEEIVKLIRYLDVFRKKLWYFLKKQVYYNIVADLKIFFFCKIFGFHKKTLNQILTFFIVLGNKICFLFHLLNFYFLAAPIFHFFFKIIEAYISYSLAFIFLATAAYIYISVKSWNLNVHTHL